jgi:hypothetical protein
LEPDESQATEPGQVTWSASIDGEGRLVVGTVEGQIFGRDPSRGKRLIPDRRGELAVVALSDDGTVMVVGDEKGALSKAPIPAAAKGRDNAARGSAAERGPRREIRRFAHWPSARTVN